MPTPGIPEYSSPQYASGLWYSTLGVWLLIKYGKTTSPQQDSAMRVDRLCNAAAMISSGLSQLASACSMDKQ
jgi:hypothetical protein